MTNIPYLSSWKRLVSGLKRGPSTPYDPGLTQNISYVLSEDIHTVRLVAVLLGIHTYVEDVLQRLHAGSICRTVPPVHGAIGK